MKGRPEKYDNATDAKYGTCQYGSANEQQNNSHQKSSVKQVPENGSDNIVRWAPAIGLPPSEAILFRPHAIPANIARPRDFSSKQHTCDKTER